MDGPTANDSRPNCCHGSRHLSILGAAYLLVVPPRAPGAEVAPSVAAMRDGLARIRDAVAPDGIGTAFEFLLGDCPIDTPALAA